MIPVVFGGIVYNCMAPAALWNLAFIGPDAYSLCLPYGTSQGWDGYQAGDTTFRARSDATLVALMQALTGKTSGISALIAYGFVGDTDTFAAIPPAFSRLSLGTTTVIGTLGEYGWDGYEPLDYDVTFAHPENWGDEFTYHGLTDYYEQCDYVLSNGGKMVVDNIARGGWTRYGINDGGQVTAHSGAYGSPDWNKQFPFACEPIGADTYAFVGANTDHYLSLGTNTKGGTLGGPYGCLNHTSQGVLMLWRAA